MIGEPMPNPRDSIIDNLNMQLEAFFGAGNRVQQVDPGATGVRDAMFGTSHAARLRAERDKLAPCLKELADNAFTVIEAAKVLVMETKRARLIARENSIMFPGPP